MASIEMVGGAPSDQRRVVGITFNLPGGEQGICSGLFISSHRILTAAHCTCDDSGNFTNFHVSNSPNLDDQWVPTRFFSRFGGYRCKAGPQNGNDLALLAIDTPLLIDNDHRACEAYGLFSRIRLIGDYIQNPPKFIVVGGYGYDGDRPRSWGTQRSGAVAVNSFTCTPSLSQDLGCVPLAEFMMGVGMTSGRIVDSCAGDSGGPAFVEVNGAFIPIGLVSRGVPLRQQFPSQGKCGSGGIYTHHGRHSVINWLVANGVSGTSDCNASQ